MDKVYIAPLRKGMSLGDMLGKLSSGYNMTLDAAVVVHGNGPWDKQIQESSPRHLSGKKLGELNGLRFPPEVTDAMKDHSLIIYAEQHGEAVLNALRGEYFVVRLAYESDQP